MTGITAMEHLDEGALVRLADGVAGPDEAAHAAACAVCALRHDHFARRAAAFRLLLAAADVVPPPLWFDPARRATRPRVMMPARLRLAAALALALAGAFGVRPVRAWIAGAAGAIWSAVVGERTDAPAPAPFVQEPSSRVTFDAQGPVFTVRVAGRQAAGALVVETVVGDASASADEGTGPLEFVILPDGLRIANTVETARGYLVRLPAGLARITVQIGDEPPLVHRPAGPGERWRFELQRAGP